MVAASLGRHVSIGLADAEHGTAGSRFYRRRGAASPFRAPIPVRRRVSPPLGFIARNAASRPLNGTIRVDPSLAHPTRDQWRPGCRKRRSDILSFAEATGASTLAAWGGGCHEKQYATGRSVNPSRAVMAGPPPLCWDTPSFLGGGKHRPGSSNSGLVLRTSRNDAHNATLPLQHHTKKPILPCPRGYIKTPPPIAASRRQNLPRVQAR